jgi:hypothetical protein
MAKRGLPLEARGRSGDRDMQRTVFSLAALLTLFLAGCPFPAAAADQAGSEIPWSQDHSTFSDRQEEFPPAEMGEEEDYILYRAGPSENEMRELRLKEEEKVEKSWDMLRNMTIIRENDRRPHPRGNSSSAPSAP